MEAIIAGDYAFEPEEYWANVSDTARSFVTECLTVDPDSRPTAEQALAHKWVRGYMLSIVYLFYLLTEICVLMGSLRPSNPTSCLIPIGKVVLRISCQMSRGHSMPRRHVCSLLTCIYMICLILMSFDLVRKAVLGMMAMKRMTALAHHLTPEQRALEQDVFKYKEESEKVRFISARLFMHI